jgi:hypothetical protein
MKIFYSWQSDSDAKLNRYFILNALEAVSKNCRKEGLFDLYIDQATREEPGSPNISDTIFKKIDGSNLFIADISIINPNSKERKTPNPNVLIESGYAIKKLGFKNTIFIFNCYYGNLNDLPFDIRQNRILSYCFDGSNKEEVANSLIKDLTIAIITIEKKSISSDKIEIVFYDGKKCFSIIDLHRIKYTPISKKVFLDNVEENKIISIDTEEKTYWQEYLLKAIRTDRSRKEALRQLPKGQIYAYAENRYLGDFTNVNFFEEYLEKTLIRKNTQPLNFMIKNSNEKSFEKIKIVFIVERNIPVLRYCDFPEYPRESKLDSIMMLNKIKNQSCFALREDSEKKYFEYDLELLRIGESHELSECLFLKLYERNEPITLKYVVYFIDMPQIEGTLTINMNVKEETINPDLLFEL